MEPAPSGRDEADPGAATVLTVVGSGTLVPNASRGSAAHHLRTEHASVLLDCGSGTLHALDRFGIAWPHLTHIAVSHYHYDHVADLPAILVALKHGLEEPRTRRLSLVGPRGFRGYLEDLSEALGIAFLEQDFPVGIVELAPDRDEALSMDDIGWRCHPTEHTEGSIAYLLETPTGPVAYTGDTGPSESLAEALSGQRVLIAECSHPDPPPTELHLTPRTLAELAAVARPELLVVTHVYPSQDPAEVVRRIADRYEGRVVAGRDGLTIRLGRDAVAVDLPGRPV